MIGEKILVTGGAGFLGSHIVERLVGRYELRILDNFERDAIQYATLPASEIEIVRGSVLDEAVVREAVYGRDIVIHCAAVAGVSRYSSEPLRTMETNLMGSWNVLRESVGKVGLFVLLSTSEVYGRDAMDVREDEATAVGSPLEARWSYCVSKVASEHLAMAFHREKGLGVVVLRPFNVYGERQVGEGAVANFCRRAIRGETLEIYGSGQQRRSWCYVSDFVRAIELVLEKRCAGEVLNIGNPSAELSVKELAELIVKLSGSNSGTRFLPVRWEEIEQRRPNTERARRVLGFEPKITLEEGLQRTIEWFKALEER